jgi:hypothetical protein
MNKGTSQPTSGLATSPTKANTGAHALAPNLLTLNTVSQPFWSQHEKVLWF